MCPSDTGSAKKGTGQSELCAWASAPCGPIRASSRCIDCREVLLRRANGLARQSTGPLFPAAAFSSRRVVGRVSLKVGHPLLSSSAIFRRRRRVLQWKGVLPPIPPETVPRICAHRLRSSVLQRREAFSLSLSISRECVCGFGGRS